MTDTHETITDIIAEKRRRAAAIERDCAEKMKRGEMISDCYARELVADIRRDADRLEAALKRETVEVSTRAAAFAINKTNEEWHQKLGNAAKLREALKATLDLFWDIHNLNRSPQSNQAYAVIRQIKAALSAPPRNCDIGTAEEQEKRFDVFVRDRRGDLICMDRCPVRHGVDFGAINCVLAWGQKPYDKVDETREDVDEQK